MRFIGIGLVSVAIHALGMSASSADAQVTGVAAAHIAAAKAAAGTEYSTTFDVLCNGQIPPGQPAGGAIPERARWYAAPVRVFDNLYFVGMTGYSAWAVNTSDGIILIDTLFGYAVEDEIVGGLTKLGLDPARIKYAIVTHAHVDHAGGAKYLQDRYGTRIILGAADWDLLENNTGDWSKPKRDMVATDGQRLTLGDTTLTLYVTPGHTLGTVSILIPVTDGGTPHLVAEWGGTGFNFAVTPDRSRRFWFQTYVESAERFRDIVGRTSADVLISNHSIFDGSRTKLPAVLTRKVGEPHPYVIGTDAVKRFLTVSAECAKASLVEK